MASSVSDADVADALRAYGLQLRRQRMLDMMADLEFAGESGGGRVAVVMDGKGRLQKVMIDPALMTPDSAASLGELIVAATRVAGQRREAATRHALLQARLEAEDRP